MCTIMSQLELHAKGKRELMSGASGYAYETNTENNCKHILLVPNTEHKRVRAFYVSAILDPFPGSTINDRIALPASRGRFAAVQ